MVCYSHAKALTGRCAHLQVVELELSLLHQLAAVSRLALLVEGEAARRYFAVDWTHRARLRERSWTNPTATRIRLAVPARRAPLSWMGYSGRRHRWRMLRACALGADRSQLADQFQQRPDAHLHGAVEVLQREVLFGITRARGGSPGLISSILAGSAVDAAQHDPLVISVLIVGDQPLGKGLVQEP